MMILFACVPVLLISISINNVDVDRLFARIPVIKVPVAVYIAVMMYMPTGNNALAVNSVPTGVYVHSC